MTGAWPQVPLAEVLERSEDWIELESDQHYKQVTVRLWGKGLTLRAEVTGSQIAASRQLRVRAREFLISRIDARHGAFGVVPDTLDGAVVSNDFPCFRIAHDRLLPHYLEWFSKTGEFVALCRAASEGSTNRVRLQEPKFMDITIPLFPLDEQRRIVQRLDTIAALAQEATELKAEVGTETRSFVYSLHKAYSEPADQFFGEFIQLSEDHVPVLPDESYPQVGVRGFAGGLFKKDAISGTDTRYKHFNRLSPELFLVSQPKGWEGAVAVCDESYSGWFASPEYRNFRCKERKLHPEYLAALLPTPWFQGELAKLTRGQGARRERLRPEMLLGLKLRMPSFEKQLEALELVRRIAEVAEGGKSFDQSCSSIIPTMLHQIFSQTG